MNYTAKREEHQKYKVFLDECILLSILFGSFVDNLRKHNYETVSYKGKEYRSGEWEKITEKIFSDYTYEIYNKRFTSDKIYRELVRVIKKYRKESVKLEFYTTPDILSEVKKKVKKVYGKEYSHGLREEILKNIEEIKSNGKGILYPIEHKRKTMFKINVIDMNKKDGRIHLNYLYNNEKKSFYENLEYEKASMRSLFVDPDDKNWLDTAYYANMNMVLTLDTRIVKNNHKLHRFIPIITIVDFDDAIKIAKEKGWKILKLEVERKWKKRNLRYLE